MFQYQRFASHWFRIILHRVSEYGQFIYRIEKTTVMLWMNNRTFSLYIMCGMRWYISQTIYTNQLTYSKNKLITVADGFLFRLNKFFFFYFIFDEKKMIFEWHKFSFWCLFHVKIYHFISLVFQIHADLKIEFFVEIPWTLLIQLDEILWLFL